MARQIANRNARPAPTLADSFGLKLVPGEEIVHVTRRHSAAWFASAAVPLVLASIPLALLIFRLRGGQLFQSQAGIPGELDWVLYTLLFLVGGLAVLWFRWLRPRKKQSRTMNGIVAAAAAGFAWLAWWRFSGGRIFTLNPFAGSGFDLANQILASWIVLMLLICAWLWLDWRDDALVLTNQRVIHDHRTLLQRHAQDEVEIRQIQNVSSSQRTYPSEWFGYSTVVVQAIVANRRITFLMAADGKALVGKIQGEQRKLQGSQAAKSTYSMVQRQIFGAPAEPQPPLAVRRTRHTSGMLGWIFYENPEIDDQKRTVTWRPHWAFALWEQFAPVSLLIVCLVLLVLALQASLLVGLWAGLVGLVLCLICFAWAAYRYSDTRNDLFILTPDSLIDVEKKPFGPENRRSASLGRVQNVLYNTTYVGQFLGYGTIVVQTAGNSAGLTFPFIPKPREAVGLISDYMNDFRRVERERSFADTLGLLRTLHENQIARDELFPPQAGI
jgi:hypothetical protein